MPESGAVSRALVTGATAGLGREFANQLAQLGADLVLVARDESRLGAAKDALTQQFGISVETVAADLTTDDGCKAVTERLATGDVDLLVNNAGVGLYKPFSAAGLEDEERQLDLNVRAVLRLTHAVLPSMLARGSGRILNVASVAGVVPRGGNATYSASKAWVLMFSESLSIQLLGSGVSVTAVCPGFVHTEFHERANVDMSHVPAGMWLPPRDVVSEALADLLAGKPVSVPSRRYKTLITIARLLPRPALRWVMAKRGM